ncbi:PD40 domain-containing protein [bacterium]|nr:PD40 domain-containing protein [bacterium]
MKKAVFILFAGIIPLLLACGAEDSFPVLSGPYLGQAPPADTPLLFAPGIVNNGMLNRDIAIYPDGKEIYFCTVLGRFLYQSVLVTREVNGRWTRPEPAPHMENPDLTAAEPFITPDGKKFLFISDRDDPSACGGQDIWVMDRTGDTWGEPYNLGVPVNSEHNEFFPSVTRDGTIYFSRAHTGDPIHYIYRSRLVNGVYEEPVKLPKEVNSGQSQFNAFIDPDERYIIVPTAGRSDTYGSTDYFISFRNDDDSWTPAVNMGETINTPMGAEYSPYVSPDGKYFFFMSTKSLHRHLAESGTVPWSRLQTFWNSPENGLADIYWVDASFIAALKPVH